MEMNASCIKNIQASDPGIDALCVDGTYITSTHTTDFTYPNIPPATQSCHIFPHLALGSLLFIGQFCDAGCEAWMDASSIKFTYKQKIVLIGTG